jgi:hypothetical protein
MRVCSLGRRLKWGLRSTLFHRHDFEHTCETCFRIACVLRLRVDIYEPYQCPCGAEVTVRRLHCLACKKSRGRQLRHDDVIGRALRSAEISSEKEPAGCSHQDGKRPDGVTLVAWIHGRSVDSDFTCADTFVPSYVTSTATQRGSAAESAQDAKKEKYISMVGSFIFVPVAVEKSAFG